jgi:hypothetical protein
MMRTQIFLGMAASSVPIRREVPNLKEELTRVRLARASISFNTFHGPRLNHLHPHPSAPE